MELQAVEERVGRLNECVRALTTTAEGLDQRALYLAPGPDDWSVMKVLAHVAELLPYWAHQAQEVASRTEQDQPFGRTHDDPDRIAAVEDHGGDTLQSVLPRIRQGLQEAATTLRALPPEGWSRTAHHSRRGEMTVMDIVDQFLVQHLQEHVDQATSIAQHTVTD